MCILVHHHRLVPYMSLHKQLSASSAFESSHLESVHILMTPRLLQQEGNAKISRRPQRSSHARPKGATEERAIISALATTTIYSLWMYSPNCFMLGWSWTSLVQNKCTIPFNLWAQHADVCQLHTFAAELLAEVGFQKTSGFVEQELR